MQLAAVQAGTLTVLLAIIAGGNTLQLLLVLIVPVVGIISSVQIPTLLAILASTRYCWFWLSGVYVPSGFFHL
jgi:hypothetical protein